MIGFLRRTALIVASTLTMYGDIARDLRVAWIDRRLAILAVAGGAGSRAVLTSIDIRGCSACAHTPPTVAAPVVVSVIFSSQAPLASLVRDRAGSDPRAA